MVINSDLIRPLIPVRIPETDQYIAVAFCKYWLALTSFIEFVHTEYRLFSPFSMSVPLFQSTKIASIYARPPVVCQYAAARQRVYAIRTGSIAPSRRGFVQASLQHQQERHSGVRCPSFLSCKGPRSYTIAPGQVWIVSRRGYKTVEEMRSRYKFGVCCP